MLIKPDFDKRKENYGVRIINKKKLSLCPYCKGIPTLREVGDWHQFYMYFCSKCGQTPVKLNEARITEWGARKIWNERCKTVIEEKYRTDSVNDIIQAYREITKEGDNTYDDDSNEN